jgi:hypothetical protein
VLTLADAERLAKVLGLLGSSHDGEVVAAARQAERIRSSLGLMWQDIVGSTAVNPERDQRSSPSWQDDVKFCRENSGCLNEWEQEFIASIMSRWSLSKKQHAVLDRLVAKCREYANPYY